MGLRNDGWCLGCSWALMAALLAVPHEIPGFVVPGPHASSHMTHMMKAMG